MKKKTIYRQFIIAFGCVVLPIVLYGVIFGFWQTKVIRKEVEANAVENLRYGMERLEFQVKAAEELQYSLINSEPLLDFRRLHDKVPTYRYYSMVSQLLDHLGMLRESNEYIKQINVYFGDLDIGVSSDDAYMHLQEGEYDHLRSLIGSRKGPVCMDEDGLRVLMEYPFASNSMWMRYIVEIYLEQDALIKDAFARDSQKQNYFFLYDYSSEQFFALIDKLPEELEQKVTSYLNRSDRIERVRIHEESYLMVSRYSHYLEQSFFQCIPIRDIMQMQVFSYTLLVVYSFLCLGLILYFSFFVHKNVNEPVNCLVKGFQEIKKENFDIRISNQAAEEFNYLYEEFNRMAERLKDLIDENYKARIYAQTAELKQMQAQISPHFLYNTYFMLHRMVLDEDWEYVEKLSTSLGGYLEYVTRDFMEEVTLKREVEHMRNYLEIQHMRFENRMKVIIPGLPQNLEKLTVPRLILQPIVENYCKYGFEASGRKGTLEVVFEQEVNSCTVIIKCDSSYIEEERFMELVERLRDESSSEVTGLINVSRRVHRKFGGNSGIFLTREKQGQLTTKIRLDQIWEKENVKNTGIG